tara:strand:- start:76 stop:891 length:816 start_codon:yes stop_codon:yes gene_type:complete
MANLKEEEIRRIVHRATMFQKFYGSSTQQPVSKLEKEYPDLFEITDSLNIDRAFVCEALLEHHGIPVEEPVIVDAGFNNAEVLGFSSGDLNPDTLKELRAQIEYHFNTVGELKHRKNKTTWKATPRGLSRFISSQNSPEVDLELSGSALKITAKQSMKTFNKFYFPALAGIFASVMFFAASVFGEMGSEGEVGIIVSVIFGFAAFLFSRFMNKRKLKKKTKLVDLVERLQQILARRQKVEVSTSNTISIPEDNYEGTDEIEIKDTKKVSTD